MLEITKVKALEYHKNGKIGIDLTKPCTYQYELSMAYTPGVAIACLEIEKDENFAFEYTNKANRVAVISNGTAVLLKKFENVDAFDIELDVHFVEKGVARVDAYDDEAYKEQLRCLIYDTSTE